MGTGNSAVVITQRERFEPSLESLKSLLSSVTPDTQVIYVDGGSPPRVARALEATAREHDFLLLRSDRFLAPNEARNLAMSHVTAGPVAFVDNDVLFEAGWLDTLIECVEATGAWLVSPLIVQQGKTGEVWHMVGGECEVVVDAGRRRFREQHLRMGHDVDDVQNLLRQRTGFVEFHCVLATRAAIDACFPLDEELRSARDHCDLTLATKAQDGEIWLEPAVTVKQMFMPDRLPATDRRYYKLRWSDPWNRRSLERFREKWELDPDDPIENHDLMWLSTHRLYGNRAYGGSAGHLPNRGLRVAIRAADRGGQSMLRMRRSTLKPLSAEVRVAHRPSWHECSARTIEA